MEGIKGRRRGWRGKGALQRGRWEVGGGGGDANGVGGIRRRWGEIGRARGVWYGRSVGVGRLE